MAHKSVLFKVGTNQLVTLKTLKKGKILCDDSTCVDSTYLDTLVPGTSVEDRLSTLQ